MLKYDPKKRANSIEIYREVSLQKVEDNNDSKILYEPKVIDLYHKNNYKIKF